MCPGSLTINFAWLKILFIIPILFLHDSSAYSLYNHNKCTKLLTALNVFQNDEKLLEKNLIKCVFRKAAVVCGGFKNKSQPDFSIQVITSNICLLN